MTTKREKAISSGRLNRPTAAKPFASRSKANHPSARAAWPTLSELDQILATPGLSLSEIARRLFARE